MPVAVVDGKTGDRARGLCSRTAPHRCRDTRTPIKCVIVICGENRSSDPPFATYRSPWGDSVINPLPRHRERRRVGYHGSGYIRPIEVCGGHVPHNYGDHVSILKFIESSQGLPPISGHRRDGPPDPMQDGPNRHTPANRPALADLMSLFHY